MFFLIIIRFLPALLPLDNPELRTSVTQRRVYDVNYDEYLVYEVEYALARLISREIAYYTELDYFKIDLAVQYDFSCYDAYAAIDVYETRFIDFNLLKNFFKACGKILKDDDLIAILRRIDRDDDGRVDYEEFAAAIKPQKTVIKNDKSHFSPRSKNLMSPTNRIKSIPAYQAILDSKSPTRVKSPTRLISPSRLISPTRLRSPTRVKSPTRIKSPSKSLGASNYESFKGKISPKNEFLSTSKSFFSEFSPRTMINGRFSETISVDKNVEKSLISRNSLRNKNIGTKTEIIKVFREIIHLEREIELAKQDLALRSDYNVFDTFRLFDKKGKSFLSIGEIEEGFNDLGIFPNKEELYLFIRRFDKDSDGKLRY